MIGIIDTVVIVLSLVLVVGAVLRAAGKKQTDAEYFLAGRDLRWPFVGMSLLASNISAEHVVGLAGDGYRVGLVTGGYEWMAAWCLIILASLFTPLYLRRRIYTIPEFLEHRFGWGLRAFLSGNLLLMNVLTKNAIDLWAGSLLLHLLFGWNQTGVMVALSILTALYTMKGGLRAVVYADMVQGTWLIISGIVLTIVGLVAVGGWSGLTARVDPALLHMVKPLDSELPITGFLIGNLFGGMFYWCMDQTNVQRVLGARSVDDGQKGAIFAGFLKLLIPFILVLPGVIAHALYPNLARADMAYPRMVSDLLPVGLRGVVLAGLIAILMSSMSACYNASATLVVRDFFMRWKPGLSDEQQVAIGRKITVLMALLGVLAAPLVGRSVTIWNYLQMLSAYLGVPLGAVVFMGLLWKRGNTAGAIAGGTTGFALGLFLMMDQTLGWGLVAHPYLTSFLHRSILVWVLAAVTMVVVSLMTAPPAQSKVEGNVFGSAPAQTTAGTGYRLWAVGLFMCTLVLWWAFR
ncbi:sodium:solute symporter family transporter [Paludibaculum fermentans]|uniref:Sodium/solute symporter n=1 Tax=Paludibaculum fermentans TaxID=1473598 RepID=A0A7S7NQT4_PALFE|nr:sodium/solute symporter [Paludibaculum fermentans]QOY88009.1 sodium/solute symporter [Paludibaculum fermentans]